MVRSLIIPTIIMLLTTPAAVSVQIYPRGFQQGPRVTARVQVHVEPHRNNRVLDVIVAGEDYYSDSQRQLEGEKAPTVFTFEFRDLPPGVYQAEALLYGVDVKDVHQAWSEKLSVLD